MSQLRALFVWPIVCLPRWMTFARRFAAVRDRVLTLCSLRGAIDVP